QLTTLATNSNTTKIKMRGGQVQLTRCVISPVLGNNRHVVIENEAIESVVNAEGCLFAGAPNQDAIIANARIKGTFTNCAFGPYRRLLDSFDYVDLTLRMVSLVMGEEASFVFTSPLKNVQIHAEECVFSRPGGKERPLVQSLGDSNRPL